MVYFIGVAVIHNCIGAVNTWLRHLLPKSPRRTGETAVLGAHAAGTFRIFPEACKNHNTHHLTKVHAPPNNTKGNARPTLDLKDLWKIEKSDSFAYDLRTNNQIALSSKSMT